MSKQLPKSKQPAFSRKTVIPGHQSKRDVGEKIPEAGTTKAYSVSLTKPGHNRLRALALKMSPSISGFIEDIAWGKYLVISQEAWKASISGLPLEVRSQLDQHLFTTQIEEQIDK